MTEEKKYPKVIVGAFIFNENNELLLVKQPKWHNKYTCIGGKVEEGETIEEALVREIKEETKFEIKDINFIGVVEDLNLEEKNNFGYRHLIFMDYMVVAINPDEFKLNEESEEYEWLPIERWLEKEPDKFAPLVYEQLKKIKESKISGDYENKYKRALADYQNLLKQTGKEKEEFAKFANEQFLYQILPIYDNLKMAVSHSDKKEHDGWIEGVKHVLKQFRNILNDYGVEEVKTVGEKFDHYAMEAVDSETTDDEEKDEVVAKEVKAGYRLNGKVIMPAKVVVYKTEQ